MAVWSGSFRERDCERERKRESREFFLTCSSADKCRRMKRGADIFHCKLNNQEKCGATGANMKPTHTVTCFVQCSCLILLQKQKKSA